MTITTNPARNEYTANAGQTIFNYTFKIFEDTDLNVYVTPSGQDCDDSTDLTTAYTVSGVGNEAGGLITLTTPTSQNDLVTIVSNVPSSRTTDYQNNGDFRPDTVNDDFDRVVSIAKKVEDLTNRTALLPQCQQGPKPLSLPAPNSQKLIRWKGDETGFENVDLAELDPGLVGGGDISYQVENVASLINFDAGPGWVVETQGHYNEGDGGAGRYLVKTAAQAAADGDTIDEQSVGFTLANGNVAVLQYTGSVDIRVLGAKASDDKSFDNKEIIKAIGRNEGLPQDLYVPAGTFYSTYTLNTKRVLRIEGEAGTQATTYPSTLQFENCLGVIFHRHNTDADDDGSNPTVVTSGGKGDGSLLRHLSIKYNQGSDPTPDGVTHGIWYKARADVRNCQISGFPGNNVNIVATSGSGDAAREGNANNFDLGYCRIINAGGDGVYTDGADANAGVVQHVDSSSNAGWGFNDESFLGNQYFGCHTNGNGVGNSKGGFRSEDANARCTYIGCYTEPGQGANNNVVSPSIIIGGLFGANDGNAAEYRDGEIRNCIKAEIRKIEQQFASSTGAPFITSWNTGSFGTSRKGRHIFKAGLTDGDNEELGAFFASPASSSVGTSRHRVGLEYYDGSLGDFVPVFTARADQADWRWGADNFWNLGEASFRAKEIFAVNGTINTSDEREKEFLGALEEAEKAAALEIKAGIRRFKWKHAVDEKGDNARIHIGVGAQAVISILESHGLDPFSYAFVCYDEWEDEFEEVPVLDEEGNETGEVALVKTLDAGNRYGIRYEELSMFIIAAI